MACFGPIVRKIGLDLTAGQRIRMDFLKDIDQKRIGLVFDVDNAVVRVFREDE